MIKENYLIPPMGKYEKDGILSIHHHGNTFTYLDWIYGGSDGREVKDPYGMGFDEYRKMVDFIGTTVGDFILKLEKEIR